jgi:hypothetical protein
MSKRYPGGLITKTPVTPTTSSAPGVWTLEQALQYIKAGTWPVSVLSDPYFNYVTMLLHGDGTNGAQNNTFLDSSTNNFTITRNGNTTQGSFSPYGSNWSNYFNGASDWANSSANAAFALGSGDFTVECWAFISSVPNAYNAIYDNRLSGNSTAGFWIAVTSGRAIVCRNTSDFVSSGSNLITLNQWNHIAVVRSSTTMTIYLNGVSVGSASNSTNWTDNALWLNRVNDVTTLNGVQYLSNLRVVKGTAVYTSAFTPSTTPLTAISGTSLLTCQSNRFIDNSSNNFAITVNGTPSVQRFSPFAPSAAYSTSVIGGSGYFDGSGDYLAGPSNSVFAFGTGDFTMECWLYPTSFSGTYQTYISTRTGTGTGADIQLYNGTTLMLGNQTGSIVSANNVLTLNTWQHIAATRSGTTNRLFVNGVIVASGTASDNFTSTGCYISSGQGGGNNYAIGYITDTRIVKGTAVYTAAFTPPTAPLTAITNTQLLTNFTNGGIFDNAMMNNLETVGDAQISTSVVKYGTGSLKFDGTGDWLNVPYSPIQQWPNRAFTLEMWVYNIANREQYRGAPLQICGGASATSDVTDYAFGTNASGKALFYYWNGAAQSVVGSTTIPLSTWTHIAVTYDGSSSIKIWVNGVLDATGSKTGTPATSTNPIIIGATNSTYYNGYIDDLRITSGYVRYTSNFTPPAAAFPNQ